jgi:hypothetical protein
MVAIADPVFSGARRTTTTTRGGWWSCTAGGEGVGAAAAAQWASASAGPAGPVSMAARAHHEPQYLHKRLMSR